MKRRLTMGLLLVVGSCLSAGCVTHGHRKVTIEFLGQTISVEDNTYADNTGQQDYTATFDEVGQLVLGWLKPEPKPETESESDGD